MKNQLRNKPSMIRWANYFLTFCFSVGLILNPLTFSAQNNSKQKISELNAFLQSNEKDIYQFSDLLSGTKGVFSQDNSTESTDFPLLKTERFRWDFTQSIWRHTHRYLNTYNGNNQLDLLVGERVIDWPSGNTEYSNSFKYNYFYESNSINFYNDIWNWESVFQGYAYVYHGTDHFFFDSNGLLFKEELWGTSDNPYYVVNFDYNSDGNLTKETHLENGLNSTKIEYSYAAGLLAEEIEFEFVSGNWVFDKKFVHNYSGSTQVTDSTIWYNWNGSDWQIHYLFEETFNGTGNKTTSNWFKWENNDWTPIIRFSYFYDENNLLSERIGSSFDDFTFQWVDDDKTVYTYDLTNSTSGSVLHVPSEYGTIQAAINAAVTGDTVLVADGFYHESLVFQGVDIVVISENGPDKCFISEPGSGTPVDGLIVFNNGESNACVLSGFGVVNAGSISLNTFGRGINIQNASPTINNCTIQESNAEYASAMYINNSTTNLNNLVFLENRFISDGLEIKSLLIESSQVTIKNCTFHLARFSTTGYDIGVIGSTVDIENSIIWGEGDNAILTYSMPSTLNISFTDLYRNPGNQGNGVTNVNGSTINMIGGNLFGVDPMIELYVVPSDEFFDYANYKLNVNSPAIDAGNPDSDPDPDGTVADLGAYYVDQSVLAQFEADVVLGTPPLVVQFTDLSSSLNGNIVAWEWDFNNDSIVDSEEQDPTFTFNGFGTYSVSLKVTNQAGDVNSVLKADYIKVAAKTLYYVPDDFATIQGAVDGVLPHDTIIVRPGTYFENILWQNKDLTLASEFLFSNAQEDIEQTIIDGNLDGTVISVDMGVNQSSELVGFTIQNGINSAEAAGLYINESNLYIHDLIVKNNHTLFGYYGGIYLRECTSLMENVMVKSNIGEYGIVNIGGGDAILKNVRVTNNTSETNAGIRLYQSNTVFDRCLVDNNANSGGFDGGSSIEIIESSPLIINSTFADNLELGGGSVSAGSVTFTSYPVFINTIFWNNFPVNFSTDEYSESDSIVFRFVNCLIQGGEDDIIFNSTLHRAEWYNENLDENPQFTPGYHVYSLKEESPCIDAGTDLFVLGNDTILNLDPSEYNGLAPDIGWFESDYTVGIEEQQESVANTFTSFPNPFTDRLNISSKNKNVNIKSIVVYDDAGRLVNWYNVNASQFIWDAENRSGGIVRPGIYYITIYSTTGVETIKIIKQ